MGPVTSARHSRLVECVNACMCQCVRAHARTYITKQLSSMPRARASVSANILQTSGHTNPVLASTSTTRSIYSHHSKFPYPCHRVVLPRVAMCETHYVTVKMRASTSAIIYTRTMFVWRRDTRGKRLAVVSSHIRPFAI